MRALSKDADDRFQSAEELEQALTDSTRRGPTSPPQIIAEGEAHSELQHVNLEVHLNWIVIAAAIALTVVLLCLAIGPLK